jgi:type I restriction enzyme S subunit
MTDNIENPNKGWRNAKIQDIGVIYSGTTPATSNESFWDGSIVWITPDDLSKLQSRYLYSSKRRITVLGLKKSSRYLLPSKSLVISTRAPIGYMAISTVDFCTNQGCKTIVFKSNQDIEFHYYNLFFRTNRLKEKGKGTTFAEISKTDLGRIIIPFPVDKKEQSKISEILSTIDEAIEKTDTKIEKLKCIKQGLMQDLFRYGIDEKGRMRSEKTHRFKNSPLGRIPKEWEVVECKELFKLTSGKSKTKVELNKEEGSFPVYGGNGVNGYSNRYLIDYPTLIIGRVGEYCGATYVTYSPIWVTDNALFIEKFYTDFDIDYLYRTFQFINLRNLSNQTGQPLITQGIIGEIIITLPEQAEQSRIASILTTADEAIEKEDAYKNKLLAVKHGAMEDLLSGKVRTNHLINNSN